MHLKNYNFIDLKNVYEKEKLCMYILHQVYSRLLPVYNSATFNNESIKADLSPNSFGHTHTRIYTFDAHCMHASFI